MLVAETSHSEKIPAAPPGTFSIVVLPDSQAYTTERDEDRHLFRAEIQWVIDHRESQKIVFVSHVGDVVPDDAEIYWNVAAQEMELLHGKVPYGISVGNHDMQCPSGDSSLFQATFPASKFEDFAWYGGQLKNNANSYQLFSAEGCNFIILHLECNAPDPVLEWANKILRDHLDRRAIVTTHMYLGPLEKPKTGDDYFHAPKGRMLWKKCHRSEGNTPQQLWDKCLRKHPHIFMVLCGDQSRTQAMHRKVEGDAGNVVHEVLSDYRQGYLRLMRFEPAKNRIHVWTYSPYLKQLCGGTSIVTDPKAHEFALAYEVK